MAFTGPGQRMQGRTAQTQPVPPRMVRARSLLTLPGDEEFDLLDNAPIPFSLQDYVLQQARLVMPHADFAIAEHLVSDLNEDGLLQCDTEEAARLLDVSAERVREVL